MVVTQPASPSFWRGKRVLLTGHTGFKGAWLTLWLRRLGAEVTGVALAPGSEPNLFSEVQVGSLCRSHICDIRDGFAVAAIVKMARPEIVFHLAAQPLVRASYAQPRETFDTNVMGTVNVLEALRGLDTIRAAVMVTTDKVYRDNRGGIPHGEDDPLGGHDPYSASKAASEIVIGSYRDAFLSAQGTAVASARAGNVIGGGDWSQDRLIPDAVRAWQAGKPLLVRRPHAVRPWQHVLEPLFGYLTLARRLCEQPDLAGAYNFGPRQDDCVPVHEIIRMAREAYGTGAVEYADGDKGPHEAQWLSLDASKAATLLDVSPRLTLAEAIARTMAWYRAHAGGAAAQQLCEADICDFESRAAAPAAASMQMAG